MFERKYLIFSLIHSKEIEKARTEIHTVIHRNYLILQLSIIVIQLRMIENQHSPNRLKIFFNYFSVANILFAL